MSEKTKTKTVEIVNIQDININALAEIKGKKESLQSIIKNNPFVEITDTATYEQAKKNRTALRTGRTDTEKEEKVLLNAVKTSITEKIKFIYKDFVTLISPAEDKQQAEVKRWEDIKETERLEKVRIDEERKATHRKNIELFFNLTKGAIDNLNFEASTSFNIVPTVDGKEVTSEIFEEFSDVFEDKLDLLNQLLDEKKSSLKEKEDFRIQKELLEKEQANQNRITGIKNKIETYYKGWSYKIESATLSTIDKLSTDFNAPEAFDFQEFQGEFEEKKSSLTEMISAKKKLLQEQETQRLAAVKLEEDKAAFAKQQDEFMIKQRRSELTEIGFDADLTYSKEGVNVLLTEDDLLADQEAWGAFIDETKDKIANAKVIPVVEVTTEEEAPKEVNANEIEVVTTEIEIQEVDFEETAVVELTREQKIIQDVVYKFYYYCREIDGELREDHIHGFVKTI